MRLTGTRVRHSSSCTAVPATNIYCTNTVGGDYFAVSAVEFTCTEGGSMAFRLGVCTTNSSLRDYFASVPEGTLTRSGAYLSACTTSGTASSYRIELDFLAPDNCSEFSDLVQVAASGDRGAVQLIQYIVGTDCSAQFGEFWVPAELTPEERARAEAEARERQARREEAEAARRIRQLEAEGRALRLLLPLLDAGQRATLLDSGYFDVSAPNRKTYRLFFALHGNVLRLSEDGTPEQAYCGHMGAELPVSDTLVSQRLILTHMPEKYERAANKVSHEHMSWCRPRDDFHTFIRQALDAHTCLEPITA